MGDKSNELAGLKTNVLLGISNLHCVMLGANKSEEFSPPKQECFEAGGWWATFFEDYGYVDT